MSCNATEQRCDRIVYIALEFRFAVKFIDTKEPDYFYSGVCEQENRYGAYLISDKILPDSIGLTIFQLHVPLRISEE